MRRTNARIALGLFLLGGLAFAARAQNVYQPPVYSSPQPNVYYGGYGSGGIYGRQGGALYGASTVMNAYGNAINAQEQARIGRESYYQQKINTKRAAFDEMMYEKANTPSYVEEQDKIQANVVRRIMNQPLPGEITSGKAQNLLLPYLQNLAGQGVQGPPIPLDPEQMKHINVTTQGQGNLGLLRDGGRLDWPSLLDGPQQKKIDALLPTAVAQLVKQKRVDPKVYRELKSNVTTLTEAWRKQYQKEEIDGGTFLQGKRYLDSLQSAVDMLVQPGTAKLLAANAALQAHDVNELVATMTGQGLKFAPAVPGDEGAYFALQDALVAYARGAQTESAFQMRGNPTAPSSRSVGTR